MEFNLTLTVDEVNIVLAGLNKLPYEVVSNLIPKVVDQANTQAAEKQKESKKTEE